MFRLRFLLLLDGKFNLWILHYGRIIRSSIHSSWYDFRNYFSPYFICLDNQKRFHYDGRAIMDDVYDHDYVRIDVLDVRFKLSCKHHLLFFWSSSLWIVLSLWYSVDSRRKTILIRFRLVYFGSYDAFYWHHWDILVYIIDAH